MSPLANNTLKLNELSILLLKEQKMSIFFKN